MVSHYKCQMPYFIPKRIFLFLKLSLTEIYVSTPCRPCPVYTYGARCENVCTCQNGAHCNGVDGSCTCSPGWLGTSCTQPCEQGKYGGDCRYGTVRYYTFESMYLYCFIPLISSTFFLLAF